VRNETPALVMLVTLIGRTSFFQAASAGGNGDASLQGSARG